MGAEEHLYHSHLLQGGRADLKGRATKCPGYSALSSGEAVWLIEEVESPGLMNAQGDHEAPGGFY